MSAAAVVTAAQPREMKSLSETQSTPVDDEAGEHIAHWSQLPHPLEAAVLHELNEPDEAVHRASEILHRNPPGLTGSTRSVWVLAQCTPSGEGDRLQVESWCWYATRQAAEAAEHNAPGVTVLHEIGVPRAVRCDGVEGYLAKQYRARSAEPGS